MFDINGDEIIDIWFNVADIKLVTYSFQISNNRSDCKYCSIIRMSFYWRNILFQRGRPTQYYRELPQLAVTLWVYELTNDADMTVLMICIQGLAKCHNILFGIIICQVYNKQLIVLPFV